MQSRGFTLLELVLSVALLAAISVFVAQTTQNAVDAKVKIEGELDRMVELREAISVMSRDLSQAFNYRDINIALYNAAQKQKKGKPKRDKNGNPISDPPPTGPNTGIPEAAVGSTGEFKEEEIVTHFEGEEDEVHFSALSFIRTQRDQKTSNQAEVGYLLKTCKSRKDNEQTSTCLWRRITPYIDKEIKEGGVESVLLENVEELRFRYIGTGEDVDWEKKWSTKQPSSEDLKGQFPYAVEINLKISDPRTNPPKTLAMTAVATLNGTETVKDEVTSEKAQ